MSQYDSLDEKYMRTQDLPSRAIAAHSIKKTMGDVNGLRVLDLACGYGFHMSCMRKYGASKVVGVDISEAMIRAAMELRGDDAAFEYRVGDCTKPAVYETEDGKKGDFDVVHGAWLLNYASNEEELVGMWVSKVFEARKRSRSFSASWEASNNSQSFAATDAKSMAAEDSSRQPEARRQICCTGPQPRQKPR